MNAMTSHPVNMTSQGNGTISVGNTTMQHYNGTLQHPPLLKQPVVMVMFLCVAYTVVFLLAVVNNSMVLAVIYKNQQMRSVTNYFLANLAAADITVSFIVLPITLLSNLFTEWYFGWFLCKAIQYLQAVVVSASVSTLAAVALERYFAIFHPQSHIITARRAVTTVLILWFIPSVLQVPWALYSTEMYFSNETYEMTVCFANFPSPEVQRGFFLGIVFLTCYIIPLCFITVCYSLIGLKVWRRNVGGLRGSQAARNIQRSKIRIVRMLITVAVVFAVAWLPLYSFNMVLFYGPPGFVKKNKTFIGLTLIPLAQLLGSATSAVNPFIYCYFSEQFRKYILELLHTFPCFRHYFKIKQQRNNASNSSKPVSLTKSGYIYSRTCNTEETNNKQNSVLQPI